MLKGIYGEEKLCNDRHRWDASETVDCQVQLLRKDSEAFGTEQLTESGSNLDFQSQET